MQFFQPTHHGALVRVPTFRSGGWDFESGLAHYLFAHVLETWNMKHLKHRKHETFETQETCKNEHGHSATQVGHPRAMYVSVNTSLSHCLTQPTSSLALGDQKKKKLPHNVKGSPAWNPSPFTYWPGASLTKNHLVSYHCVWLFTVAYLQAG